MLTLSRVQTTPAVSAPRLVRVMRSPLLAMLRSRAMYPSTGRVWSGWARRTVNEQARRPSAV